jgi:hypothetical protein
MKSAQLLGAAVLAAGAVACSSSTGPGAGADGTVSLSFTTRPATSSAQFSSAGMMDDTIISGGDVIVITRAQIVLREIELKRQDDDGCESLGMHDDDGCEEFSTGAMLVDLPLNGQVATAITIAPDTGVYDEVDFELHKPEDDTAADSAFLAQHPDFTGVSIRVQGTFNGEAFTFESDLNVEQEHHLSPPLVVTDTTTATNVTLSVEIATWFRNGASLVDPRTANKGGQNEGLVKENIKTSFRSFEDHDRDGDDGDEF